eukprot:2502844-Pyramimonas_sp.AAC.1
MLGRVEGPRFAWRGMIAGCGFATTLIRVFSIGPLDDLQIPAPFPFGFTWMTLRYPAFGPGAAAAEDSRKTSREPLPICKEPLRAIS